VNEHRRPSPRGFLGFSNSKQKPRRKKKKKRCSKMGGKSGEKAGGEDTTKSTNQTLVRRTPYQGDRRQRGISQGQKNTRKIEKERGAERCGARKRRTSGHGAKREKKAREVRKLGSLLKKKRGGVQRVLGRGKKDRAKKSLPAPIKSPNQGRKKLEGEGGGEGASGHDREGKSFKNRSARCMKGRSRRRGGGGGGKKTAKKRSTPSEICKTEEILSERKHGLATKPKRQSETARKKKAKEDQRG